MIAIIVITGGWLEDPASEGGPVGDGSPPEAHRRRADGTANVSTATLWKETKLHSMMCDVSMKKSLSNQSHSEMSHFDAILTPRAPRVVADM